MKIYEGADQLPPSLPYPVVTIGNFDGVHRGHKLIFHQVVHRAQQAKGTSIVVTFRPHPQRVLKPEASPHLLTDFSAKLALIEQEGLDAALVIPFTLTFARTPPATFISEILHDRIDAKELFVGHDFAFGKDRAGTIALLETVGKKLGISVTVVGPVEWEGETVSSSIIRRALVEGDPGRAADLLGRPFSLSGKVVGGYKEGRILGFPTANLQIAPEVLLPAQGVYAVRVRWEDKWYGGVANIGTSPTFPGRPLRLEVHIFDFIEDLYEEDLEVAFIARLREERRFPSVEELAEQIREDVKYARSLLAQHPAPPEGGSGVGPSLSSGEVGK